jgi:DHA1 family multidrug resistance protein-like MFS transporter
MNKKAFFTLAMCIFTTMLGMSILSPLMAVYATKMGADGFWLGVMFSGFSLSRAFFQPVSGWLSDRYNRKTLLMTGYTLISIGYAFASTIYQLTTVRLLHGVGSALVTPVAMAYVGDIIPKGKEGTYMNIFMMFMYLGMAAGPVMGGLLNESYGMNIAFYTMAAIAALALLLLIIFVPQAESHSDREKAGFASIIALLKEPHMRASVLHLSSRAILRQGVIAFMPLYATKILGMGTGTIGLVVSIFIFVEAISQGIIGPIADRVNKKMLLIGGTLIAAILAFFLGNMTTVTGMLSIMIPIAIFTCLARASASAYSVEIGARLKCMGACSGLFNASQDMGNFIGPILFGWVTDRYGLSSMFLTGAIAGIIAVPFMFLSLYGKQNNSAYSEKAKAEPAKVVKH